MQELGSVLEAMVDAARTAGAGLLADFRSLRNVEISEKGPADFVSSADLGSQRVITEVLMRRHPSIPILGEEGPASDGAEVAGRRFVVDPLDGTTNFLHGIPHFAVSIGLEEGGEVIAGVILDPCRNELFSATRGHGCFLDSGAPHVHAPTRAACSTRSTLADAVVATGIPHRGRPDSDAYLKTLAAVMNEVSGIRRFGAAALDLAYVAVGRFDVFFERGLKRWDLSAGSLLVEEAGGTVTEDTGEGAFLRTGNVLATNGRLHDSVTRLLAR